MATTVSADSATQLRTPDLGVADLTPVAGPHDHQTQLLFDLCDPSLSISAGTKGQLADELWCQHIRRVLDADTVYLIDRNNRVVCSSAGVCDDDIHPDTLHIHRSLASIVTDLHRCDRAAWLAPQRIFADQASMSALIVPLKHAGTHRTALIIDPALRAPLIDEFITATLSIVYQSLQQLDISQNSIELTERLQCLVFDSLRQKRWQIGAKVIAHRLQLFKRELRRLHVSFERLSELDGTGESGCWGWLASVNRSGEQLSIEHYQQTAARWGAQFCEALDIQLLQLSAQCYQNIITKNASQRFDEIKPFCLQVFPISLQSERYIDVLSELIEKGLLHGPNLVFELIELDKTDRDIGIVEAVAVLRQQYGIRIAIDKFVTGSQSFERFLNLIPEVIKLDRSILTGSAQTLAMELLQNFVGLAIAARSPDPEQQPLAARLSSLSQGDFSAIANDESRSERTPAEAA